MKIFCEYLLYWYVVQCPFIILSDSGEFFRICLPGMTSDRLELSREGQYNIGTLTMNIRLLGFDFVTKYSHLRSFLKNLNLSTAMYMNTFLFVAESTMYCAIVNKQTLRELH